VRRIGRRLTYANIAATLALVLAMSGGALAATHYLISSTKQISPKVLKQLRGKTGRAGPQGRPGAEGPIGPRGNEGKGLPGPPGERGEEGVSATSPLPSGKTVSGSFAMRDDNGTTGKFILDSVTFPVPLEHRIPLSHIEYTKAGSPTAHCIGPRHAAQGYLCVYGLTQSGVEATPLFLDPESETEEEGEGTAPTGVVIEFKLSATSAIVYGTYSVTAP
jgi:hypothetical protein